MSHNPETCPECSDRSNAGHCGVCESYGGWSHHDPSITAMQDQVDAKYRDKPSSIALRDQIDARRNDIKYSGICRKCSTLRTVSGKCGCTE